MRERLILFYQGKDKEDAEIYYAPSMNSFRSFVHYLHLESKYGTAISILGALILGDAAVKAGIVSPIMIITIAICFISSLVFTNPDFSNALRIYRFLFLFGAAILGIYGILLVFIFFLINLCSTYTVNKPYTIPVAPLKKNYFFIYIWRKNKK